MIEINRFESPIGIISLLGMKNGIVKISFENTTTDFIQSWCLNYFGDKAIRGNSLTQIARMQILYYLGGRIQKLNFPVIHKNSLFRKKGKKI